MDRLLIAFTFFSAAQATVTSPMFVVAGSAAALFLFAYAILRGRTRWLLIGEDNRYSNSKFQLTIWFWTLISVYAAAIVLRVGRGGWGLVGGVDIPQNLLVLSAMSAMSFAGAKQITTSRISALSSLGSTRIKPPSRSGPHFPSDLVTDDSGHRPDIGDFQMLVVTLLAIAVYLVQVTNWLHTVPLTPTTLLPDVDRTLLGTFGIGQGAYLAKKYIGDSPSSTAAPGPILTSEPPRPN
jgi:hypothetical protein